MPEAQRPLAVLIDADNVSSDVARALAATVARLGAAQEWRLYGNASGASIRPWAGALAALSIEADHRPGIPGQKNAADIRLVIDAMALAFSSRVGRLCLVSSDSDFTPLVREVRRLGLDVHGFGRRQSRPAYKTACTRFTCIEDLQVGAAWLIREAITELSDADDWALLSRLGNWLRKAGFDTGGAKLSRLIRQTGGFDLDDRAQRVRLRRGG